MANGLNFLVGDRLSAGLTERVVDTLLQNANFSVVSLVLVSATVCVVAACLLHVPEQRRDVAV